MTSVKCTGTLIIMGILISFNITLLSAVYRNNWLAFNSESSGAFPGIFSSFHQNTKMKTFPGILQEIPRNPSEHSQRSLHSPHSVSRSYIHGFINSLIQYPVLLIKLLCQCCFSANLITLCSCKALNYFSK